MSRSPILAGENKWTAYLPNLVLHSLDCVCVCYLATLSDFEKLWTDFENLRNDFTQY